MLKQKRVAICFSGQIRDWQFAKKNILNFFSPSNQSNIKVDYFIHTWDTNTWRYPKTNHPIFKDKKHNDLNQFLEAYSPVKYHMSVYDANDWKLAWDPLFYSFEYSVLLKQQYELENNFVYDIVVKARPDVVYNPGTPFPFHENISSGTCYTSTFITRFPSEFNKPCFDDVMFFGDSKTMDLMSGLYKYYDLKNKPSRCEEMSSTPSVDVDTNIHLGPGTLLYQYAVSNNIHPDCKYYIDYAVVRSTMKGKGLDSVDDYDKIKKIAGDWYI